MLTGYRQPGLWNRIKDTLHFGSKQEPFLLLRLDRLRRLLKELPL
jgi:hypothetical protein